MMRKEEHIILGDGEQTRFKLPDDVFMVSYTVPEVEYSLAEYGWITFLEPIKDRVSVMYTPGGDIKMNSVIQANGSTSKLRKRQSGVLDFTQHPKGVHLSTHQKQTGWTKRSS